MLTSPLHPTSPRTPPPSPPPHPFPRARRDSPLANFSWHKGSITSIEWAPDDENCIAVASSDSSVTIWDMSLEEDDDAELAMARAAGLPGASSLLPSSKDPRLADVPPQLLFEHRGQEDNKECHWHPQLPGVVFSTAADGMNVFKPDVQTVT
jgi:ribosome assembly protein RRB1